MRFNGLNIWMKKINFIDFFMKFCVSVNAESISNAYVFVNKRNYGFLHIPLFAFQISFFMYYTLLRSCHLMCNWRSKYITTQKVLYFDNCIQYNSFSNASIYFLMLKRLFWVRVFTRVPKAIKTETSDPCRYF